MERCKAGGVELSFIAIIILTIVGFTLIMGVLTQLFTSAEDETAEHLCQKFNLLRMATKGEAGSLGYDRSPNACMTLHKTEAIPTKEFDNSLSTNDADAADQIVSMASRCWWMFLEGREPDIFNDWFLGDNKCFTCYTFFLNKNVNVDSSDLQSSLSKAKIAKDTSDKCSPLGGGYCRQECGGPLNQYIQKSEEVSSDKCTSVDGDGKTTTQQCCVDVDKDNECLNKGGECRRGSPPTGMRTYPEWSCNGDATCFVAEENLATYLDYLQGTKNTGGGKGYFLVDGIENGKTLSSGKTYAVTFVAPGKSMGFGAPEKETAESGAETLAAGTLTVVYHLATSTNLVGWFIKGVGAAATAYFGVQTADSVGDYEAASFILVSDFNSVSQFCEVQGEAGE